MNYQISCVEERVRFNKKSISVPILCLVSTIMPQVLSAAGNDWMEEVVVTATKREASLQDVPISVTAFSETQLEAYRPSNLEDLGGYVPNMYMPPSGERNVSTITLRGLGAGISRTSGKSVGVYIDGVYIGGNTLQNIEMADVQRIEVLKGPQGTLFGRDTIGGAINITTRKPGNELTGHVETQIGRFDRAKLKASVDVPVVSDVMALRFSGLINKTGGYINNESTGKKLGKENLKTATIQAYYTPVDSLNIRLSYTHLKRDDNPNSAGESSTNLFSDQIPYLVNVNDPEFSQQESDSLSLSADYELSSGYRISSVTGWSAVDDFYAQDTDWTPLPIIAKEYIGEEKEWSQEIRLTSPEGERMDYLVGLYYFTGDYKLQDVFPTLSSNFLSAIGVPAAFHPTFDILDGQRRDIEVESLAIFTHLNYHLTDKLTIFGGLRYTADEKSTDYSMFGETFQVVGFSKIDVKADTKDEPLSWSIGGRYSFSDDVMAYASVARGFRSSSIKDYFVSGSDLQGGGFFTEPEFLTNYELGIKADVLDQKLRANMAVFYMDYTDIQVAISQPPNLFVRRFVNAAKAKVKGVELDLLAEITDNLHITATAGYLTSKYEKFKPDPLTDFKGFAVANSPEWTASLAADYSYPLSSGGSVSMHVDYRHATDPAGKSIPGSGTAVGGYGVANAWFGYQPASESWKVTLWVENLLDIDDSANSTLWNSGFGPFLEHETITYERPRTYGLTLRYNF